MPTDIHSIHDQRQDRPHDREAMQKCDIALMLCEALAYTQSPMQAEPVIEPSRDELKARS